MAELQDVTLDGKPLLALRVTDLRGALEQRGLARSGSKGELVKRLRGALMLENLQKKSALHTTYQPNSQIGKEMSQNSFIKQYLEKQQELLQQRLARDSVELREAFDVYEEIRPPDPPSKPPDQLHTGTETQESTKYTPKKSHPVLDELENLADKRPSRRERRSPRVGQTQMVKSLSVVPVAAEEGCGDASRVCISSVDLLFDCDKSADEGKRTTLRSVEETWKKVIKKAPKPKSKNSSKKFMKGWQGSLRDRRSQSFLELSQDSSEGSSLEVEEIPKVEERVPPLLSLEGLGSRHFPAFEKTQGHFSASSQRGGKSLKRRQCPPRGEAAWIQHAITWGDDASKPVLTTMRIGGKSTTTGDSVGLKVLQVGQHTLAPVTAGIYHTPTNDKVESHQVQSLETKYSVDEAVDLHRSAREKTGFLFSRLPQNMTQNIERQNIPSTDKLGVKFTRLRENLPASDKFEVQTSTLEKTEGQGKATTERIGVKFTRLKEETPATTCSIGQQTPISLKTEGHYAEKLTIKLSKERRTSNSPEKAGEHLPSVEKHNTCIEEGDDSFHNPALEKAGLTLTRLRQSLLSTVKSEGRCVSSLLNVEYQNPSTKDCTKEQHTIPPEKGGVTFSRVRRSTSVSQIEESHNTSSVETLESQQTSKIDTVTVRLSRVRKAASTVIAATQHKSDLEETDEEDTTAVENTGVTFSGGNNAPHSQERGQVQGKATPKESDVQSLVVLEEAERRPQSAAKKLAPQLTRVTKSLQGIEKTLSTKTLSKCTSIVVKEQHPNMSIQGLPSSCHMLAPGRIGLKLSIVTDPSSEMTQSQTSLLLENREGQHTPESETKPSPERLLCVKTSRRCSHKRETVREQYTPTSKRSQRLCSATPDKSRSIHRSVATIAQCSPPLKNGDDAHTSEKNGAQSPTSSSSMLKEGEVYLITKTQRKHLVTQETVEGQCSASMGNLEKLHPVTPKKQKNSRRLKNVKKRVEGKSKSRYCSLSSEKTKKLHLGKQECLEDKHIFTTQSRRGSSRRSCPSLPEKGDGLHVSILQEEEWKQSSPEKAGRKSLRGRHPTPIPEESKGQSTFLLHEADLQLLQDWKTEIQDKKFPENINTVELLGQELEQSRDKDSEKTFSRGRQFTSCLQKVGEDLITNRHPIPMPEKEENQLSTTLKEAMSEYVPTPGTSEKQQLSTPLQSKCTPTTAAKTRSPSKRRYSLRLQKEDTKALCQHTLEEKSGKELVGRSPSPIEEEGKCQNKHSLEIVGIPDTVSLSGFTPGNADKGEQAVDRLKHRPKDTTRKSSMDAKSISIPLEYIGVPLSVPGNMEALASTADKHVDLLDKMGCLSFPGQEKGVCSSPSHNKNECKIGLLAQKTEENVQFIIPAKDNHLNAIVQLETKNLNCPTMEENESIIAAEMEKAPVLPVEEEAIGPHVPMKQMTEVQLSLPQRTEVHPPVPLVSVEVLPLPVLKQATVQHESSLEKMEINPSTILEEVEDCPSQMIEKTMIHLEAMFEKTDSSERLASMKDHSPLALEKMETHPPNELRKRKIHTSPFPEKLRVHHSSTLEKAEIYSIPVTKHITARASLDLELMEQPSSLLEKAAVGTSLSLEKTGVPHMPNLQNIVECSPMLEKEEEVKVLHLPIIKRMVVSPLQMIESSEVYPSPVLENKESDTLLGLDSIMVASAPVTEKAVVHPLPIFEKKSHSSLMLEKTEIISSHMSGKMVVQPSPVMEKLAVLSPLVTEKTEVQHLPLLEKVTALSSQMLETDVVQPPLSLENAAVQLLPTLEIPSDIQSPLLERFIVKPPPMLEKNNMQLSTVLEEMMGQPSPTLDQTVVHVSPLLQKTMVQPSPLLEMPLSRLAVTTAQPTVLESTVVQSSPMLERTADQLSLLEKMTVHVSPILKDTSVKTSTMESATTLALSVLKKNVLQPSSMLQKMVVQPSYVLEKHSPLLKSFDPSLVLEMKTLQSSPMLDKMPVQSSPMLEKAIDQSSLRLQKMANHPSSMLESTAVHASNICVKNIFQSSPLLEKTTEQLLSVSENTEAQSSSMLEKTLFQYSLTSEMSTIQPLLEKTVVQLSPDLKKEVQPSAVMEQTLVHPIPLVQKTMEEHVILSEKTASQHSALLDNTQDQHMLEENAVHQLPVLEKTITNPSNILEDKVVEQSPFVPVVADQPLRDLEKTAVQPSPMLGKAAVPNSSILQRTVVQSLPILEKEAANVLQQLPVMEKESGQPLSALGKQVVKSSDMLDRIAVQPLPDIWKKEVESSRIQQLLVLEKRALKTSPTLQRMSFQFPLVCQNEVVKPSSVVEEIVVQPSLVLEKTTPQHLPVIDSTGDQPLLNNEVVHDLHVLEKKITKLSTVLEDKVSEPSPLMLMVADHPLHELEKTLVQASTLLQTMEIQSLATLKKSELQTSPVEVQPSPMLERTVLPSLMLEEVTAQTSPIEKVAVQMIEQQPLLEKQSDQPLSTLEKQVVKSLHIFEKMAFQPLPMLEQKDFEFSGIQPSLMLGKTAVQASSKSQNPQSPLVFEKALVDLPLVVEKTAIKPSLPSSVLESISIQPSSGLEQIIQPSLVLENEGVQTSSMYERTVVLEKTAAPPVLETNAAQHSPLLGGRQFPTLPLHVLEKNAVHLLPVLEKGAQPLAILENTAFQPSTHMEQKDVQFSPMFDKTMVIPSSLVEKNMTQYSHMLEKAVLLAPVLEKAEVHHLPVMEETVLQPSPVLKKSAIQSSFVLERRDHLPPVDKQIALLPSILSERTAVKPLFKLEKNPALPSPLRKTTFPPSTALEKTAIQPTADKPLLLLEKTEAKTLPVDRLLFLESAEDQSGVERITGQPFCDSKNALSELEKIPDQALPILDKDEKVQPLSIVENLQALPMLENTVIQPPPVLEMISSKPALLVETKHTPSTISEKTAPPLSELEITMSQTWHNLQKTVTHLPLLLKNSISPVLDKKLECMAILEKTETQPVMEKRVVQPSPVLEHDRLQPLTFFEEKVKQNASVLNETGSGQHTTVLENTVASQTPLVEKAATQPLSLVEKTVPESVPMLKMIAAQIASSLAKPSVTMVLENRASDPIPWLSNLTENSMSEKTKQTCLPILDRTELHHSVLLENEMPQPVPVLKLSSHPPQLVENLDAKQSSVFDKMETPLSCGLENLASQHLNIITQVVTQPLSMSENKAPTFKKMEAHPLPVVGDNEVPSSLSPLLDARSPADNKHLLVLEKPKIMLSWCQRVPASDKIIDHHTQTLKKLEDQTFTQAEKEDPLPSVIFVPELQSSENENDLEACSLEQPPSSQHVRLQSPKNKIDQMQGPNKSQRQLINSDDQHGTCLSNQKISSEIQHLASEGAQSTQTVEIATKYVPESSATNMHKPMGTTDSSAKVLHYTDQLKTDCEEDRQVSSVQPIHLPLLPPSVPLLKKSPSPLRRHHEHRWSSSSSSSSSSDTSSGSSSRSSSSRTSSSRTKSAHKYKTSSISESYRSRACRKSGYSASFESGSQLSSTSDSSSRSESYYRSRTHCRTRSQRKSGPRSSSASRSSSRSTEMITASNRSPVSKKTDVKDSLVLDKKSVLHLLRSEKPKAQHLEILDDTELHWLPALEKTNKQQSFVTEITIEESPNLVAPPILKKANSQSVTAVEKTGVTFPPVLEKKEDQCCLIKKAVSPISPLLVRTSSQNMLTLDKTLLSPMIDKTEEQLLPLLESTTVHHSPSLKKVEDQPLTILQKKRTVKHLLLSEVPKSQCSSVLKMAQHQHPHTLEKAAVQNSVRVEKTEAQSLPMLNKTKAQHLQLLEKIEAQHSTLLKKINAQRTLVLEKIAVQQSPKVKKSDAPCSSQKEKTEVQRSSLLEKTYVQHPLILEKTGLASAGSEHQLLVDSTLERLMRSQQPASENVRHTQSPMVKVHQSLKDHVFEELDLQKEQESMHIISLMPNPDACDGPKVNLVPNRSPNLLHEAELPKDPKKMTIAVPARKKRCFTDEPPAWACKGLMGSQEVHVEKKQTKTMVSGLENHAKGSSEEAGQECDGMVPEVQREHTPAADPDILPRNTRAEKEMAQDTAEGRVETDGEEAAVPTATDTTPVSEEAMENSCRSEDEEKKETAAPKVFNRKISVVSAKASIQLPPPPGAGNGETETAVPTRKRRWGASTATTQKKPSISITTESLKNLIPDIKPAVGQDVVLDLHADDVHMSEDENERSGEESSQDKGLKICRTVTQVVQPEAQENGQGTEEEKEPEEEPRPRPPPPPEVPMENEVPPPVEPEIQKVTLADTLIRRSISQQKTGVSITIDDPVRTSHVPSPPRFKVSTIVHISNLVRPFTLGQLKELLGRTGAVIEDGFWIDKIKSHCYVTYSTLEEAIATRNSLHGVKWPQSNPKFLFADYAEQSELDFHKGLLVDRPQPPKVEEHPKQKPPAHPRMLPPPALMHRVDYREPERSAREQWAEREREMERRERTRAEREWDRDKVREAPPRSRSRSRDRRRKERAKSKEKKSEKKEKEKTQEEPPAKLLDDLFRKTKAAPCIYWLPLTPEQVVKKIEDRAERVKEREKLRKEQEEEERKERLKEREKEREAERTREPEREKRLEPSRDRGGRERPRDFKRRSRSRSTPVRDRGGRR
ncbi:apoptotic chromatin condensation inducer in the nucleus isoform X2 [Pleurodeles waltl]|uniref:apoptotic chromatin condensation inducer in the nucleus isoform X2 n=1 Tax=Pleurodeles waltl TaxID=8319 RepID=UPI003709C08D